MYIKREVFPEIITHLSAPETTLIVGPRQAGKTTLMERLRGHTDSLNRPSVSYSLDVEAHRIFFASQPLLVAQMKLDLPTGGVVFIDEIQRKNNAGLFLKGIYDMKLPYKFVISGSGSLELKEKIHESLAGRKRVFELNTINFVEFVNYKTLYQYEDRLADYFALSSREVGGFLEEYLRFGGYPKVVLANGIEEKQKIIAELYESYLERDILQLLGVDKSNSFTSLTRVLASQIGQLANIQEISATLGIHRSTVNKYLWYMQKTFFIHQLTPFFRNMRKELTSTPAYYFYDLGMRNYALGTFGVPLNSHDGGWLFQNFVHNALKPSLRYSPNKIHFWRTQDKAEVDFVLDVHPSPIPIEVKYQPLTTPTISRSFRSFLARYPSPHAYIVHVGSVHIPDQQVESTLVHFIQPYTLDKIL